MAEHASSTPARAPHNNTAWDDALAAWRAAEAIAAAGTTDAELDAAAEAEFALISTPAPDLESASLKLERLALSMMDGRDPVFDSATARAWLAGPTDWMHRVLGAVYLDMKRLSFFEQIATLHPNGPHAARRAARAGVDPDDCLSIQLQCKDRPDEAPRLHFRKPGQPGVTIVVGPFRSYETDPKGGDQ